MAARHVQQGMIVRPETVRRGNGVVRYHSQNVLRRETVGEHSANVAGLLIALYHPGIPGSYMLAYAVLHDHEEQYTGDLPADLKETNKVLSDVLSSVAVTWRRKYRYPVLQLTKEQKEVLKFCDAFDCFLKCQEEEAQGNKLIREMTLRATEYVVSAAAAISVDQYADKAEHWLWECGVIDGG